MVVIDFFTFLPWLSPLTFSPPNFSSSNVSKSSLTWKVVNTVHIDQMPSAAQPSGAQLCSWADQQPGLSSVRVAWASEVAHASITVQFALSHKMENRTSQCRIHTSTKLLSPHLLGRWTDNANHDKKAFPRKGFIGWTNSYQIVWGRAEMWVQQPGLEVGKKGTDKNKNPRNAQQRSFFKRGISGKAATF